MVHLRLLSLLLQWATVGSLLFCHALAWTSSTPSSLLFARTTTTRTDSAGLTTTTSRRASSITTTDAADTSSATASTSGKDNDNNNNDKNKKKKFVQFAKYHGLGNDFILVDDRDRTTPSLTPDESAFLCNRNFGVGADGVIFALQPSTTEQQQQQHDGKDEFDFAMRIYNSDGSEPEMCGNGIRCFAQFLHDLAAGDGDDDDDDSSQGDDKRSYRVDTLAGPVIPVLNRDGTITVDMGEPELEASKVPTTLEPNYEFEYNNKADDDVSVAAVIEQSLTCNNKEWKVSAVSMGNPHAIIFVDDLDDNTVLDFETDGPALEACTDAFPARTNVEFVQVLAPNHLKMKVWERGAGPTLACGTGACALTVAAICAGKIPRPDDPAGEDNDDRGTRVTLPGGDLFIEWRESDNKVYMTGPAEFAFSGTAKLN